MLWLRVYKITANAEAAILSLDVVGVYSWRVGPAAVRARDSHIISPDRVHCALSAISLGTENISVMD